MVLSVLLGHFCIHDTNITNHKLIVMCQQVDDIPWALLHLQDFMMKYLLNPKLNQTVGQQLSCGKGPDFPNRRTFAFECLWCKLKNEHPCIGIRQVSMSMFSSYLATRVGEAANPGPTGKKRKDEITVAISNRAQLFFDPPLLFSDPPRFFLTSPPLYFDPLQI